VRSLSRERGGKWKGVGQEDDDVARGWGRKRALLFSTLSVLWRTEDKQPKASRSLSSPRNQNGSGVLACFEKRIKTEGKPPPKSRSGGRLLFGYRCGVGGKKRKGKKYHERVRVITSGYASAWRDFHRPVNEEFVEASESSTPESFARWRGIVLCCNFGEMKGNAYRSYDSKVLGKEWGIGKKTSRTETAILMGKTRKNLTRYHLETKGSGSSEFADVNDPGRCPK